MEGFLEISVFAWSSFTKFYLKISHCCSQQHGSFCSSSGGSTVQTDMSLSLEVGPGNRGVDAGGLLGAVGTTA